MGSDQTRFAEISEALLLILLAVFAGAVSTLCERHALA